MTEFIRQSTFKRSLVTASTSPAPTADTLNRLVLLQLRLGHTTDTSRVEIRLFRLDTAQAAELNHVSIT